jgi:hypothetical protein
MIFEYAYKTKMPEYIAAVCAVICLIVIYLSWRAYRDTSKIRKKIEEEEDNEDLMRL